MNTYVAISMDQEWGDSDHRIVGIFSGVEEVKDHVYSDEYRGPPIVFVYRGVPDNPKPKLVAKLYLNKDRT